jgi:transcriptional regulator with XRE-family HTH domain
MSASAARATKRAMTSSSRGPAYQFWLAVQRSADRLGMSIRELADRSGVAATSINRLQSVPHRDRASRRKIVLTLADALNAVAAERRPGEALPFGGEDEVLRLAGLAEPELDDQISVRESIERSAEYTDSEKQVLLNLLDFLDGERQRAQVDRGHGRQTA